MHYEMAAAWTMILIILLGGVFDLFLTIPIVALYISFIKRLISYYKVTKQLNAALKKRV
ncbi:Uncharacterised protein [Bartonella grahamii]|uniref:Uncharacterized protein n=2 Tax=Bartonella grahamii TaxID=33045 RepID=A0A336NCQ8_BARGR|nr:hypothetical protein [Bartonella grahamii]SSZ39439.1 Uncharacterised protein [Bartonella grahamii]